MINREVLISDIELRLSRFKPSDDFNLEKELIGHWIDLVRADIANADIRQLMKEQAKIPSEYIKELTCVIPVEDTDCVACGYDRFYISLEDLYTRFKGDGIIKVWTNTNRILSRTTHEEVSILYGLKMSKPTYKNMWFYYSKSKVYIVGYDDSQTLVRFNIQYIPSDLTVNDTDEEYALPDYLINPMMNAVEEIGRRAMSGFQDFENDGSDRNKTIPN